MVHQHYKLVNRMSAAENIFIGLNRKAYKNINQVKRKINDMAEKYGFSINPDKNIADMSVSEKQTVEIVKALVKGARILILDEPTAVLTPQESHSLFEILHAMKKDGKAIILITHKLQEVLDVSDRVVIMRKGKNVDLVETAKADIKSLTEKMVGKSIQMDMEKPRIKRKRKILSVKELVCRNSEGFPIINHVSFDMFSNEILGVAGIAGSGQKELCEALAGVTSASSGSILFHGETFDGEIREMNPYQRSQKGIKVGFVPEDRLGMGLISSSGMVDNMLLRTYRRKKGILLEKSQEEREAQSMVEQLGIVTPSIQTHVRLLSGGNVQKILLGREIQKDPDVLILSYPVRGLDINSSYLVYQLLNEQKKKGTAVLFVGEDLDILMQLCDRILVLSDGAVSGIFLPEETTKDNIGYYMTKTTGVMQNEK